MLRPSLTRWFNLALLSAATGGSALSWAQAGISAKQCHNMAKTDMENAYCQILEQNSSANLPNFYQFRQNPPKMQLFLLKTPARKEGIELPGEEAVTSSAKQRASALRPAPVITAAPEEPQRLKEPSREFPSADKSQQESLDMPKASTAASGLENCELNNDIITCKNIQYALVTNLMLQELDAQALTDHNQLLLPMRQGNDTTMQYLSTIYPLYVEKMLRLGLAGATMSFTKFHSTFHETVKQGLSFTARFKEMYELLKNERKTQAIQRRYNEEYPSSIAACMRLTGELIACDNVQQNWIYRRTD